MKNLAATIRTTIKAAGFKAKVRVAPGGDAVQVIVPTYESRFTPDQIETFCRAAKALNMTFVQRLPIDVNQERKMTGRMQWEFYPSPGETTWHADDFQPAPDRPTLIDPWD